MNAKSRTIWMLGLVAAAAIAAAGGPPEISIEERVRDVGTVSQGQVLDVVFEIRNKGDEPLEISVRPTCGCTVADFDPSIPANGEGSVHARVDTTGFSGRISKAILVHSNDPAQPAVNLVIRAEVHPVLAVLPKPLVRMDTARGHAVSEKVVVAAAATATGHFEITEVRSASSYVVTGVRRLEGDEMTPGGGDTQFELTISLTEEAPVGFVNTPVTVFTDHPDAPKVEVKVVGMVRS